MIKSLTTSVDANRLLRAGPRRVALTLNPVRREAVWRTSGVRRRDIVLEYISKANGLGRDGMRGWRKEM